MDALNKFTEQDMIEQITLLDGIKEAGKYEAIPDLFELLAAKKCGHHP